MFIPDKRKTGWENVGTDILFCWDYIKRMKWCIRLEDVCREVSKSDWKLFIRSSIAEWQENYMERLVKESIDLLKGEGNASDQHYDKKYEDYIFQQSGIVRTWLGQWKYLGVRDNDAVLRKREEKVSFFVTVWCFAKLLLSIEIFRYADI